MKKTGVILLFVLTIHNLAVCQEKKEMMSWDERVNKAKDWFGKTDKDGDGMVSLEEFPERIMCFWPLTNTNGDNFLSWEEELAYQVMEHEQVFIKEMSKADRICEIQHQLDGDAWPEKNRMQDVSGEWLCFTTMSEHCNPGNGVMYIILTQDGTKLSGDLRQLKRPHDDNIALDIDNNGYFKGKNGATVTGDLSGSSGEKARHNMIILHRKNLKNNFQAIFTGSVSADGKSIIAQLINNNGNYGTMIMIRRDSLTQ